MSKRASSSFAIYLPNAGGDKGILIAAALGAWCDPSLGLELFRDLAQEDVARARRLIEENKVWIGWNSGAHARRGSDDSR